MLISNELGFVGVAVMVICMISTVFNLIMCAYQMMDLIHLLNIEVPCGEAEDPIKDVIKKMFLYAIFCITSVFMFGFGIICAIVSCIN